MVRKPGTLLLATAVLAALCSPAGGAVAAEDGWSLSPSEIRVDGIHLGEATSFEVTLTNNEDVPVTFSMNAATPDRLRMRPGYTPLPDAGWISFPNGHFRLAPRSTRSVSVVLAVPPEGDWGGRSYEAWLTASSQGLGVIQVELIARLLISTSAAHAPGRTWLLGGAVLGCVMLAGGLLYAGRRRIRKLVWRLQ